jgi:hypothetical protein
VITGEIDMSTNSISCDTGIHISKTKRFCDEVIGYTLKNSSNWNFYTLVCKSDKKLLKYFLHKLINDFGPQLHACIMRNYHFMHTIGANYFNAKNFFL